MQQLDTYMNVIKIAKIAKIVKIVKNKKSRNFIKKSQKDIKK